MAETRAVRIIIHGRVQGVGMRYFLLGNARGLGLSGWVRNCSDGTVECIAQGDGDSVDSFLRCTEQGPPSARVTTTEVQNIAPDPQLNSFSVRP